MSIDNELVKKIARLSRISLSDEEIKSLSLELTNILDWIEQLSELNTDNVDPVFSSFDEDGNILESFEHGFGVMPFVFTHREHQLDSFFSWIRI